MELKKKNTTDTYHGHDKMLRILFHSALLRLSTKTCLQKRTTDKERG